MSRSYKHTPYCGMPKDKFYKRYANRKLRRKKLSHNLQHKSYRKDHSYYDICDYCWMEPHGFEEYYHRQIVHWYRWQNTSWGRKQPFPTRESCWNDYCKMYVRK